MSPAKQTNDKKRENINKLKRAFAYNIFYKQGSSTRTASLNDCYLAHQTQLLSVKADRQRKGENQYENHFNTYCSIGIL